MKIFFAVDPTVISVAGRGTCSTICVAMCLTLTFSKMPTLTTQNQTAVGPQSRMRLPYLSVFQVRFATRSSSAGKLMAAASWQGANGASKFHFLMHVGQGSCFRISSISARVIKGTHQTGGGKTKQAGSGDALQFHIVF